MELAAVAARPNPDSGAGDNKQTEFLRRHYPASPAVSYKECMRNHAAGIGGHALDGCREFMPSPASHSGDPASLTCAACGCHRNFHRRDPDDPAPLQLFRHRTTVHRHRAPPPAATSPANHGGKLAGGGRKRFRTKFSNDQKEKMYEFAERLGWKLQRVEKMMVEDFCREIGVGKEVLKVWMHNNKNTLGRREPVNGGRVAGDNGGQVGGAGEDDNGGDDKNFHGDFANGSSSSG